MSDPAQTLQTPASSQATQAPQTVHRIFTATLIMGPPGSGKTSQAENVAEYLWETFRKILLLYSWDGGAIPTGVQKRMRQGLIRFWRAKTRSAVGLGIETVYLATKGYWPAEIDPQTGETTPSVKLIAPLSVRYVCHCPKDHLLQSVPAVGLIQTLQCPTCKIMIPVAQQRITETVDRAKGFDLVGGVFFDGITSISQTVMDHMDHSRGSGQIGGEKSAFGGTVVSGEVKFGGNNRADYGFAQSRAKECVNNSLTIPFLVEGPVFTALSMEASDDSALPIVGPKLAGRAAADEGPAWFGNVLEQGKTIDDAGAEHFTLFLRPFTDAQGRRHLLKSSASPGGVPPKLVDPAEGQGLPFSVANLGHYFRALDQDLANAMLQELPGGPGPEVPSRYGEPMRVEREEQVGVVMPAVAVALGAPGPKAVAPAATPAVPLATMPVMVKKTAPTPTLSTMPAPAVVASPPPPDAVSPASPLPTAQASSPVPVGSPPPPPGMRPPARVPGKDS